MNNCPKCSSHFHDIHGVIFTINGEPHQCQHIWHLGPSYDPNKIAWTRFDRIWCKGIGILCD